MTRLTMWQTVLQSQLIHSGWTVEDHLAFLEQEGYDLNEMYFSPEVGWTREEVVERWLRENIRAGRVTNDAELNVYVRERLA